MSITPPRAPPETLTITQLCRQSGVTPRALRHYEAVGLLSPRRENQSRIYSRRERVRLQLILKGRHAGFTLHDIRDLFETYDRGGRDAQLERALPLFKEQLAALQARSKEVDDALETLRAASERMAVKLGATLGDSPDPSTGAEEPLSQTPSPAGRPTPKRQPFHGVPPTQRRRG